MHASFKTRPAALWLSLVALLGYGCAEDPDLEIPEGLQSLDPDNRAAWPEDHAETLDVVAGIREDELIWAHARGYVHASLNETWEALQEPDVVIDRADIDSYEITGSEPGYDVSFTVHCISHNIVTVEWDMAYRESAVIGTVEQPELVALRAEKTAGSEFFEVLTWSLHLEEVEEGVTSWEFVEQMVSIQKDAEPLESFALDLWVDAVAFPNGEDLPDYSEEEN